MTRPKDSIYASPLGGIKAFKFYKKVAAFFPDKIQRSVPGYQASILATSLLAGRFERFNSICYDLSCSVGTTLISRFHKHSQKDAPNANVEIRSAYIRDQKRSALENLLIPETFKTEQSRLLEAGFNRAEVWLQYFSFASIPAFK